MLSTFSNGTHFTFSWRLWSRAWRARGPRQPEIRWGSSTPAPAWIGRASSWCPLSGTWKRELCSFNVDCVHSLFHESWHNLLFKWFHIWGTGMQYFHRVHFLSHSQKKNFECIISKVEHTTIVIPDYFLTHVGTYLMVESTNLTCPPDPPPDDGSAWPSMVGWVAANPPMDAACSRQWASEVVGNSSWTREKCSNMFAYFHRINIYDY